MNGKADKEAQLVWAAGEFVALPALPFILSGTPKGQLAAAAFLCLLSLAKQRKWAAAGPPPASLHGETKGLHHRRAQRETQHGFPRGGHPPAREWRIAGLPTKG